MRQKIYQIDAFAEKVFSGNPAAVCPLQEWLADELLLQIAAENNLAETAFYVKHQDVFELRWFTPAVEVDLCGHATLAAAYVLFNLEGYTGDEIEFLSPLSGSLKVRKNGDNLSLNFPVDTITSIPLETSHLACFKNVKPFAAYKGKSDIMLVFESETEIAAAEPQILNIEALDARGVIITAPGENCDFVSRFFGPKVGINEDPVTGSAHTTLIPYWANKLQKNSLSAQQLSARKGNLETQLQGDRVEISGKAQLYMMGEIFI
ncbi:MAG: PhzF family phenazine biosynthesis protein [Pedobacter sp.]|nr:MAG: PhzF family phenazine biosynthesis protein [Pedobacter sp.]